MSICSPLRALSFIPGLLSVGFGFVADGFAFLECFLGEVADWMYGD